MIDIQTLFLFDQLELYGTTGEATYQMKRGTFQTKDHVKRRHRLTFEEFKDGIYWYVSNQDRLGIQVNTKTQHTTLTFLNQTSFNRLWFHIPASETEHFYGCGEQFTEFDLKGKKATIWVSEHHSVGKILRKFLRESIFGVNPHYKGHFKNQQTYYAQPTFLSSRKYLVHIEADGYQQYHFDRQQTVLAFREIPKKIHILMADDFLSLSTLTSNLLGRQPRLPKWTQQGVILASQGGIEALREHIEKAKQHHIPLVGIWSQDWSGNLVTAFGYQVYWNWQVSDTLYPHLKEEIQTMAKQGIRFLGYINTFLKEDTPLYLEAKANQFLVRNQQGEIYHIKSTTFQAGIMDLTHPGAWKWVKQIIQTNMIDLGMKGWMADFGEYLPTDAVVYQGDPEHIHNIWPSLWAKVNAEAIQEAGLQDEVFFFTRAGYTQTMKYSNTMWAGDQHVDFSREYGLPSAIVSSLSMATIGIGVNHSDIGGYTTILHMKRSKELLIRWLEMNVFSPLLRCHEGNQPLKNAQYDDDQETLDAFHRLSTLFQQLSPYLSDLKDQYAVSGYPIIRPLFFHYDEPWTATEAYQYLYGPDILVSPVLLPNQKEKEVHLPQDEWIQFITKTPYLGGKHLIQTPLGQVVAFYRAASKFRTLFDSIS